MYWLACGGYVASPSDETSKVALLVKCVLKQECFFWVDRWINLFKDFGRLGPINKFKFLMEWIGFEPVLPKMVCV